MKEKERTRSRKADQVLAVLSGSQTQLNSLQPRDLSIDRERPKREESELYPIESSYSCFACRVAVDFLFW